MNRIYSLAALVLIGGSLSAQRLSTAPLRGFNKLQPSTFEQHPGGHAVDLQSGQRDVVFTEDFANGLAGNNGVGAWTTSGPNGDIWRYSHTGPIGAYSDPVAQIIESPTVANGFMMFNSDSANSIFGTDTTIVAAPVEFVGSLVSPVMDLSATPFVQMNFSERFRYCCSTSTNGAHFVDISTDGGATWPTRLNVENGVLDNNDSGTLLYSVNLTAGISADPGNVRFRFTQDGSSNGVTHYHWQIDDINIETLPPNDLKITNSATTIWDFDTAVSYDSLRYTIFPVSEIRGLALNMDYFNNGSEPATNVEAHFTADDGYDQTYDLGDVAPGVSGTQFVGGTDGSTLYTPTTTLGDHNITFELTSDAVDNTPDDNTATAKVAVSNFIFARDEDSRDGGTNDTDDGTPFLLGNWMNTQVDETIYGIDVCFSIASETGVELNAQILNDAREPIAETGYVTITDGDRSPLGGNHFVHFIFDTPYQLPAGDYFVCVQHFGGANVLIGTSGNSQPQTSLIYQQSSDTWFYTTSTPMVRLDMDETIGITENDIQNGVGLGQNYPNPTNSTGTHIAASFTHSTSANMVLRDVNGKLVQTLMDGTMSPGVHTVDVNTSNLDAGVYFYTLTTNDMVSTKRMTVVR